MQIKKNSSIKKKYLKLRNVASVLTYVTLQLPLQKIRRLQSKIGKFKDARSIHVDVPYFWDNQYNCSYYKFRFYVLQMITINNFGLIVPWIWTINNSYDFVELAAQVPECSIQGYLSLITFNDANHLHVCLIRFKYVYREQILNFLKHSELCKKIKTT